MSTSKRKSLETGESATARSRLFREIVLGENHEAVQIEKGFLPHLLTSWTGTRTFPPACSSCPASLMLVFDCLAAADIDCPPLTSSSPLDRRSLLGSSYSSASVWYATSMAWESCSENVTNFFGGGAGFVSSWWLFKSLGFRFGIYLLRSAILYEPSLDIKLSLVHQPRKTNGYEGLDNLADISLSSIHASFAWCDPLHAGFSGQTPLQVLRQERQELREVSI
jgi:hypothetical protein